MQTYGDYGYNPVGYVQPMDITISLDELEKENRELEERNKVLSVELQWIQKSGKSNTARRAIAYKKAMNVKLSEAQTRELIDEQLLKVGWYAVYVFFKMYQFYMNMWKGLRKLRGEGEREIIVYN